MVDVPFRQDLQHYSVLRKRSVKYWGLPESRQLEDSRRESTKEHNSVLAALAINNRLFEVMRRNSLQAGRMLSLALTNNIKTE